MTTPATHPIFPRTATSLAVALVLALGVACDREQPPDPADEPAAASERTGQPEAAVEGARADRPDIGLPEKDLSRAEVQRYCGTGCSGTVCIAEDRRCDCVALDDACEISSCRDDDSCTAEGTSG